jgi:hypothetical protein
LALGDGFEQTLLRRLRNHVRVLAARIESATEKKLPRESSRMESEQQAGNNNNTSLANEMGTEKQNTNSINNNDNQNEGNDELAFEEAEEDDYYWTLEQLRCFLLAYTLFDGFLKEGAKYPINTKNSGNFNDKQEDRSKFAWPIVCFPPEFLSI